MCVKEFPGTTWSPEMLMYKLLMYTHSMVKRPWEGKRGTKMGGNKMFHVKDY